MAACQALFFVALIAVSQAAPRPQNDVNSGSQQTNGGSSPPGEGGTNPTPNTGSPGATSGGSGTPPATSVPGGSLAIIIPPQLLGRFFPSASAGGTSSGGGSVSGPLAALISVIPNAIQLERDRFGNAVGGLVQTNAAAIGDIIDTAATTGGKFLSNGVKLEKFRHG